MRELIIIGSGPAGYTAAIYAARANLAPVVVASSVEFGGDLMLTTEVDNFPGFPDGVMGPELMMKMQAQAEKHGAEIIYDDATELVLDGPVKKVTLGNGDVLEAKALVFATGSAYRKLGLPEEETLSGHGLSSRRDFSSDGRLRTSRLNRFPRISRVIRASIPVGA